MSTASTSPCRRALGAFVMRLLKTRLTPARGIWWQVELGNPGPGNIVEHYGIGNGMDLGTRWEHSGAEHGGLENTVNLRTRWIWA